MGSSLLKLPPLSCQNVPDEYRAWVQQGRTNYLFFGNLTTSMDSLVDPDSFRGQPDTTFREEESIDEKDDFEYFRSLSGLVAIGVPSEEGDILLMNSPHGWRLPYGPVESGADWVSAARRFGTAMTARDITIETAERITKIDRQLKNGNAETTSYDVVLRAVPVKGQPVGRTPDFGPWADITLEWFSDIPEDAYWEHGDAVDDIERCLERNTE